MLSSIYINAHLHIAAKVRLTEKRAKKILKKMLIDVIFSCRCRKVTQQAHAPFVAYDEFIPIQQNTKNVSVALQGCTVALAT